MNWQELISISISDKGSFDIKIGLVGIIVFLLLFIVLAIWRKKFSPNWDVVEAEIPLGNIGKVKIKPSYDDIQIAHKAWVELATRKAALPFDEEYDVIVEVYNSWYALFGEMRNLAKTIPANKIRQSKDTQELVRLIVESLNLGLRPHLTKWQAKFRRWYSEEEKKHPDETPQEIQKRYEHFGELVKELKEVNGQLVVYANFLKQIAQGKK